MSDAIQDGRRWLAAAEAVALLQSIYDGPLLAREALIDQAGSGLLASKTRRLIVSPPNSDPITNDNCLLALGFWQQFDVLGRRAVEDWTIGNFAVAYPDDINAIAARAFGVQFCDQEIRNIPGVPAYEAPPSPTTVAYEAASDQFTTALQRFAELAVEAKAQKPVAVSRKPVSPSTLKAWWELCKSIREPAAWSADEMRAFFDQCLPDKAATREQLRDVRGKQKSGPKPRSAE